MSHGVRRERAARLRRAHYCGSAGADSSSVAWLTQALMSIIISLFISNSISILMSKGVLPAFARFYVGRRAKDQKGAPPEKRGIMGVSNRVDETAKRIRAKYGAKPGKEFMDRQAQDDIEEEELTVTESESDDDLGAFSCGTEVSGS